MFRIFGSYVCLAEILTNINFFFFTFKLFKVAVAKMFTPENFIAVVEQITLIWSINRIQPI